MSIRAAVQGDIPQLLALIRRYWEFEGIAGFEALRIELLLKHLIDAPHSGAVWVAEVAGQLIGYLVAVSMPSLEHRGLMAEIDELYVVPEARSRGVGRQLLASLEQALTARGCVRLQLQLGVANTGARAFYRRLGYGPREGYTLYDKPLTALRPAPPG
jgi:ribosomal protein S18 acetylase RimI-like enzyme